MPIKMEILWSDDEFDNPLAGIDQTADDLDGVDEFTTPRGNTVCLACPLKRFKDPDDALHYVSTHWDDENGPFRVWLIDIMYPAKDRESGNGMGRRHFAPVGWKHIDAVRNNDHIKTNAMIIVSQIADDPDFLLNCKARGITHYRQKLQVGNVAGRITSWMAFSYKPQADELRNVLMEIIDIRYPTTP